MLTPLHPLRGFACTTVAVLGVASACTPDVTQENGPRDGSVSIAFTSSGAAAQLIDIATALDTVTVYYGTQEDIAKEQYTQLRRQIGPRFVAQREDVEFKLELSPGTYGFAASVVSNLGVQLFAGGSLQTPVVITERRFRVNLAAQPVTGVMVIDPGGVDVQRNAPFSIQIRNSGSAAFMYQFVGMTPPCCVNVFPRTGQVNSGQSVPVSVEVRDSATSGTSTLMFEQFVMAPTGQRALVGRVQVQLSIR